MVNLNGPDCIFAVVWQMMVDLTAEESIRLPMTMRAWDLSSSSFHGLGRLIRKCLTVVLVGNAMKRMDVMASTFTDLASHNEIWTTVGFRPFALDVSLTATSKRAEINLNGRPVKFVSHELINEFIDNLMELPD